MKTLSSLDLAIVTGGSSPRPSVADTAIGGGSSTDNSQFLSTLQGIQSSLSDLSKNQSQGPFGGANGLMFMTMALAMSRRNDNVYVVGGGGGGWHHHGFRFRVW